MQNLFVLFDKLSPSQFWFSFRYSNGVGRLEKALNLINFRYIKANRLLYLKCKYNILLCEKYI